MSPRPHRTRRFLPVLVALGATLGMLLAPLANLPYRSPGEPAAATGVPPAVDPLVPVASSGNPYAHAPLEGLQHAAAYGPVAGSTPAPYASGAEVSLLLTLSPSNSSELSAFLQALNDPNASQYHRYLTAAEFARDYGASPSTYDGLVAYLRGQGVASFAAFPDRLTLGVTASALLLGSVLHASVGRYAQGASTYWALAGTPKLPLPIADRLAAIDGLGASALAVARPLAHLTVPEGLVGHTEAPAVSGYLSPVTVGGVQYLFPSDLQVTYDEQSLLGLYGDPTNASVAALLWSGIYGGSGVTTPCGTLTPGQPVGAYDPEDTSSFFGNTTPTGEPAPRVVSVSVLGSPAPGCLASYDSTGVEAANTAELETIGSVAPGVSIYAVSAPGPTIGELDTAFATVLSPPSNLSAPVRAGLANVSVVSVGWGTVDQVDAAWNVNLAQAEARGISVVAATGDSGGDTSSSAWVGTQAEFPASDAGATDGALAVGGTTLTLNPSTLHVATSTAWNVSAADTAAGGPLGSSGGISTEYAEPSFQESSEANSVLDGGGRGVPDVAALANNSLVTITVAGRQYLATNATAGTSFRSAEGTAVAAGYVGGLLAVIDHTLRAAGDPALGYLDPTLYALATEQFTLPSGSGLKVDVTGSFDYGLPTTPVRDVSAGRSYADRAVVGWDLVTGWGAIDAYNLTMYVLDVPTHDLYGALSGVEDQVKLTSLEVTTKGAGGVINTDYNASLEQDLFLANSLGAPIYWVQSVVYLHHVQAGWAMNFTAWVAYPFWPLYPRLTVYEYRWPTSGQTETLPVSLTLMTDLLPGSGSSPPQLKFTYGAPGGLVLALNVPGAATIIGRTGYSYSWQGTTYTDGPDGSSSAVGFLAPQLVVVGGPPSGTANFGPGTSAAVTALVERSGDTAFTPASIGVVNATNAQSGEGSLGLGVTLSGGSGASLGFATGSTSEGIYQVEPLWYPVTFVQSGLSAGSTWFVNLSDGETLSAPGSSATLSTAIENGSYTWSSGTTVSDWASEPPGGAFKVNGAAVQLELTFGPAIGSLTFLAKGPGKNGHLNFPWYVNITGLPSHVGTATTYQVNLTFGSYTYKVASSTHGYYPSHASGTVNVTRSPTTIYITFATKKYFVEFVFELPKSPPRLTISMGGVSTPGSFKTWGLYEPNGSYPWKITGLALGYVASPASGTVVVHGAVAPITIVVTEPGWGPFGLGVLGYALVFGVPVLAGIWIAVLRLRRRARRRKTKGGEPPSGERPADERRPARSQRAPRAAPSPPKRPPRPSRDLRPDEL